MTFIPPFLALDFYKTGHRHQYKPGTGKVYSNLTARSGKHSNVNGGTGICWVGLQMFIKEFLIDDWNRNFFNQRKEAVCGAYATAISEGLGYEVTAEHLESLHDLGYLPLHIKALPEGTFVPYGVPAATMVNTIDEFFWLTNAIESVMSAELWGTIASATTTLEYLRVFKKYAEKTGSPAELVPFQAHDFSFRGMMGRHAAALSSVGALLAGSMGTDTVPGIVAAKRFYGPSDAFVAGSVNATEHSVMCSYLDEARGDLAELESLRHLMNNVHPTGILSIVCDTWDFWKVVTEYLPILKEDIMARDGKVVIRPDSGDPVHIMTGDPLGHTEHEVSGLVECLWHTFGGTHTETGHRLLDEHIGCIYGDSITLARQEAILHNLWTKNFASANVVLGVGSYTYQMVTRDTHGIAVKATWCEIDGKGVDIFKDPKTDDGTKKSLRGRVRVDARLGVLEVTDECSEAEERGGLLDSVFVDGSFRRRQTVDDVRRVAAKSL
jgi:nicotinamide phosphoribosyltransferase